MATPRYDVAVIGGGIVGLATAMTLVTRYRLSLIVVEAEGKLATHQTGNNSGVIHAGLYYKPGSLKARNCVVGREELFRFCAEQGVAHERCGKLVVATRPEELPALDELERRGQANGLEGLRRLGPEQIKEREPHCAGLAGLFVPQTGIVDYRGVARAYARIVSTAGGTISTSARVLGCRRFVEELVLQTTAGDLACRGLIACAGLYSDRVARLCGIEPGVQIVPFRGEYYELTPERTFLVRNLIYPVPDPRFPFLGVHFTRMVQGGIEAGPNAVLAFCREGYSWRDFSLRDTLEMLGYRGFWRMARKYTRTGLAEMVRSFSKGAFVYALQRLVPELKRQDIRFAGAGVRAQALGPDGALVDDFHIVQAERMIHVLNAPSPAATASLSIGRTVATLAAERFGLSAANKHADC
jgi:L-2-hydroxyglutarate oxidase